MKTTKLVIGLAAVFMLALLAGAPAMADSISFVGFGGSFSFANTSGSSLSVTDAGISEIADLVNSALDSAVSSGLLNLTSGSASSTCPSDFVTCTVNFDDGGSLTVDGSDSAAGITMPTNLLSATFADGSATFSVNGSGTFSGDLTSITLNSGLASYYGLTSLSGSDAQTYFSVSFTADGFNGSVGTSGVTVAEDAPEPSSIVLLALVLLSGPLVLRRRVFV
jgi:hypothetical protein